MTKLIYHTYICINNYFYCYKNIYVILYFGKVNIIAYIRKIFLIYIELLTQS